MGNKWTKTIFLFLWLWYELIFLTFSRIIIIFHWRKERTQYWHNDFVRIFNLWILIGKDNLSYKLFILVRILKCLFFIWKHSLSFFSFFFSFVMKDIEFRICRCRGAVKKFSSSMIIDIHLIISWKLSEVLISIEKF